MSPADAQRGVKGRSAKGDRFIGDSKRGEKGDSKRKRIKGARVDIFMNIVPGPFGPDICIRSRRYREILCIRSFTLLAG